MVLLLESVNKIEPSPSYDEEIQVIVTDMRMPEMSGLELLRVIKEKYAHIVRIVLSGHAQIDSVLDSINKGEVYRFILKPWDLEGELKATIRQAIEYYELRSGCEVLIHFFQMWADGVEPDYVDINLIEELVRRRKRFLYDWRKKCESAPADG